jgi:protein-L-isoaspartate(D-aspartate) O-methyltransferase
MVREQLLARGVSDQGTLSAFGLVPREVFVPPALRGRAYADCALSIGNGQTISQPYMVARMTEALRLADLGWPWTDSRPVVLDVGTGSGYQAAVLAQLGARVISIERDPELAEAAVHRLAAAGYDVEVVVGDGSLGLPRRGPFAGIVVAAGAPTAPPPLIDQLLDGGRLVIPVGSRASQRLDVLHRVGRETVVRSLDHCVFVPLIGRHGHPA